MSLLSTLDIRKSTGTWIGHGLATVGAGLLLALVVRTSWAFALGTVVAACYYGLHREEGDKAKHVAEGNYDHPQDEQGVTSRVDKVGDTLGPVAVAAGAVLQLLVGWIA